MRCVGAYQSGSEFAWSPTLMSSSGPTSAAPPLASLGTTILLASTSRHFPQAAQCVITSRSAGEDPPMASSSLSPVSSGPVLSRPFRCIAIPQVGYDRFGFILTHS